MQNNGTEVLSIQSNPDWNDMTKMFILVTIQNCQQQKKLNKK